MRRLFVVAILLLPSLLSAQIQLQRQVLSSGAVNGSGSVYLSSSVGQVLFTTAIGTSHTVTQGFEQPSDLEVPAVIFTLNYSPCNPGASVQIDQLIGCLDGDLSITANGAPFIASSQWLEPGIWTLGFSTGDMCIAEYEVIILEKDIPPCDLVIYNMLTPNGDLANDFWFIENIEYREFASNTAEIFNRWGQLVWRGENYDNTSTYWDGRNSDGVLLPRGTYFYSLKTDLYTFEGFVELKF